MLGGQRLTQTSKLLSHLLSQRGAAALSTQSLIGSQRSAVTLGGAVPGYDPTDIPHPSTRAPEGEGLSRRAQGWWSDPATQTASTAYDAFVQSLQRHSVVRQRHVQELIRRCRSEEDLSLAVKGLHLLRRHRASVQNHEPFNHNTTKLFVQAVVDVGAPKVAAEAWQRCNELGLAPTGIQLEDLLKSAKGDLQTQVALIRAAKAAGVHIASHHVFHIARCAMQLDQRNKGIKLVKKLVSDKDTVRPAVWRCLKLSADGSPLQGSKNQSDSSPAGAESDGDEEERIDPVSPAGGPAAEPAAAEDERPGFLDDDDAKTDSGGVDASDSAREGATKSARDGAPPGVAS
mmetsp:Transcript_5143/g.14788  ORF Transcript_5143/g.14788 Transcript_5143/m.14788 type:complete len:345 (-) Transcript_5143:399-1433(-)